VSGIPFPAGDGAGSGRDDGERLDGVTHVGAGQAVVAPAALPLDPQEAPGDELGQVVAGGLGGDPGPGGQLTRRPRLATRQRQAHGGAGGIGQEIRHECDVGLGHRGQA
jgi:hypothetical protein